MSHKAFLRARSPEHKQQRREAILAAARELALRDGVRTVSLGGVAAAVGLVKSNLARYFATREEIFLELAAEEFRGWEAAAVARVAVAPGPESVLDALVETLDERPLFCDLLSHSATTLERNATMEAARAFKLQTAGSFAKISAAVAQARPDLTGDEAGELVAAAAGFAGLLYPAAHPPPVLARLYAEDAAVAALCFEFVPVAKRMLRALAAGLPSLRGEQGDSANGG
ncbi:TetR family transcriptional regulator [Amycolatopsis endophytica]|uniref:AcrR family transcriptional regulator n=1 Tax=Amycolatopsis endophytica TaxID=860233 RepID=A0A853B5N7_9PSEU|nr:TetR family transcriptional regulator [Amycolatopsis endophytica]NYI90125.1 AcrR family transcriptional regulator [Amycolatopsis endophytica]